MLVPSWIVKLLGRETPQSRIMTLEVSVVFTYILFFLKVQVIWDDGAVNLYGSHFLADLMKQSWLDFFGENLVRCRLDKVAWWWSKSALDRYGSPYSPVRYHLNQGPWSWPKRRWGRPAEPVKKWHSFTTQTFKIPGARREWILSADPFFSGYFQYDTWDNKRSLDLFDLTWHWIPIGEVLGALGTGVSLIPKSIIQRVHVSSNVSACQSQSPLSVFSPSPRVMYFSQRIHGFFRKSTNF